MIRNRIGSDGNNVLDNNNFEPSTLHFSIHYYDCYFLIIISYVIQVFDVIILNYFDLNKYANSMHDIENLKSNYVKLRK